nr:ribonuclease H-like domain-containing protein [Tanacetum cinerariifolium]
MSYDDIRPIFKAKFNSNVDFLLKTKEQIEEDENRALQMINETPAKKAAKRRKLNEEVEDLKRHLQIVPNEDDDVYTEATPLARKVLVVDYEIIEINNKPYYKIIRADGTHQLYISFLTLLRNFDKEDLEALWSLVKERFSTAKPKNFFDDFLLTTLGAIDAFNDLNWQNAIQDEYNALIKNNTWTLVPRPTDANIVRCMWLFRHKYLVDGTLSHYKARLVANGSTQIKGVDVDETFSPVVKPGTIRTVLSLAISRYWPVHQLDVKNVFLHGDLSETIYMYLPLWFWNSAHTDYVCLLQRSLFSLKQAHRAWFQRFAAYITRVGFSQSRCDSSLFIYRQGNDTAYLLLYVDDIVLTASFEILLQRIISSLHQEFSMTDMGSLNYFLGISVTRDSTGMFLSQRKYATEILEHAHTIGCNSSRTPVVTNSKLGDDGDPVCLHMHDPREPHFSALKRILRYVRGTLDYGLQLFASSTTSLVAYSDAGWAGCPTTRRSTSGYCVFLGNNLLSWSSKRQPTLSRSSAKAEYRGVANAVAETCYAVYLSSNLVQHQRTKHVEIDIHFVRDLVVAGGLVRVLHVPSRYQYADIFTKGLPSVLFKEFRTSLSVRCPPAPTAGEC